MRLPALPAALGAFACKFAALLLCATLLAACGEESKEPEQRVFFIELLKKNILEKRGIRFPLLTDAQKSAVGPYAAHYELLNALSEDEDLLLSFSGLPELQKKLMDSTDPARKKQLILEAGESMKLIREKLINAYKKARSSKESLVQPDDLQAVYDEAFLKVVQAPTDLLVDLIDQSLEAVDAARALNEYLLQHPDAAHYKGSAVIIQKPEAEADIQALFESYRERSEKALQTVRELNNLTW